MQTIRFIWIIRDRNSSNITKLEEDLEQIDTLRKIDIFDYNSIHNEFLLEDIRKYGKQIY